MWQLVKVEKEYEQNNEKENVKNWTMKEWANVQIKTASFPLSRWR